MAPSPAHISDTENNFAKTQLAVFFSILILAVDSINPIKIFQHVFPIVATWHIATLSIILMLYVFISEMKQLLYYTVKIFFHSILSIFFREVNIIGHQNIPRYGPVIFTSNHANQFMDSVVVLSSCQRSISFLMAEHSYKKRIVGDIAWAMGVVPVKRAQDSAIKGLGLITVSKLEVEDVKEDEEVKAGVDGSDSDTDKGKHSDTPKSSTSTSTSIIEYIIKGTNTKFTEQIKPKDKIRFKNCSNGLKVKTIKSNTEMIATGITTEFKITTENSHSLSTNPIPFELLKRIEQSEVYEKVLAKLSSAGTIGIFPEGGSHDRTDLLPLKAGVALIAYSALEKDGLSVPIVPVGLNYFERHKIRGRVTVEFGRPIYIDPATLPDFLNGGESRRNVCNDVLERIEDSLRGVIVSAPDYQTLKIIHTARRLYRTKYVSSSEKQDLSRRFAEGYKQLLLMTRGNPPQSWLDLQERLHKYQKELDELGIRDYQVPGLSSDEMGTDGDHVLNEMKLPFRIAELLLLFLVSLIPSLFLNVPVGIVAHYWALWRRKKAMVKTKVKIKGMDVMLTEKVLLCIVLVPSLWIFYGLSLYLFTDVDLPTLSLFIYSFPLFSYMGIVTTEAGMVELKDLKPIFKRLFPSTRRRMLKLPGERKTLQNDLRDFIKTIGPSLGEVYSEKKLDWADFQQNMRNGKRNSTNDLKPLDEKKNA
jgi:glycerol-3-phosphate O-acyltransferase/dihydroxyacetone phosphate acyltransferase